MSLEALYSPKTVVFIIRKCHHSVLGNPLFRSRRNALKLNGLHHDVLVLRDKHNVGLNILVAAVVPTTTPKPMFISSLFSGRGICNLVESARQLAETAPVEAGIGMHVTERKQS